MTHILSLYPLWEGGGDLKNQKQFTIGEKSYYGELALKNESTAAILLL